MITNAQSASPVTSKVERFDDIARSCSQNRIVIIEDTGELQCAATNAVILRAADHRILIGNVRDGSGSDLLNHWNTGHPRAAATFHGLRASSAWKKLRQRPRIGIQQMITNSLSASPLVSKVESFMSQVRAVLINPYFLLMSALLLMLFFGAVDSAHAADATPGGGAGLPWETPLRRISQSFSGPVAFVIALLGIIACGATLIWGGEVSEFARRIIYLVLVICLIVFANSLLTGALFSGAVVPHDATVSAADLADYAKAHAATLNLVGGR